jgi:hypothetical protein
VLEQARLSTVTNVGARALVTGKVHVMAAFRRSEGDDLFDRDEWADNPFRQSTLIRAMRELQLAGSDLSHLNQGSAHQHLLPRFILSEFAVLDGRAKRVFQLDTTSGAAARPSIRDAAARSNFYTLEDDKGQRHTFLEGYLALIDHHAALALDRLRQSPRVLTEGDRATLSFMLAAQEHRSFGGNQRIQQFVHRQMQLFLATRFSDDDAFHANVERQWNRKVTREEALEFREKVNQAVSSGDVKFQDLRAIAHQLAFDALYSHAVEIYGLAWSVLEGSGFITSDRGLAMFDPAPRVPWAGNGVLSSPKAETTIPLSPTMCLLLRDEGDELLYTSVADDAQVSQINLRTYGWADRFVYGPTEEQLQALHERAMSDLENVPRPVPHRQVMLMPVDPEDPSFAKRNHAAGLDPYIYGIDGDVSDYVVIDENVDPVEMATLVSRTIDERVSKAMKRNPELAKSKGSGRFRTFVDREGHVSWAWVPEPDGDDGSSTPKNGPGD